MFDSCLCPLKIIFHVDLDNAYNIAASTRECLKLCMPCEHVLKTFTLHGGPICNMKFGVYEGQLIGYIHTV